MADPNFATTVTLAQFQKVGLTIAKVHAVELNRTTTIPSYRFDLDLGPSLTTEHSNLTRKMHYVSSAQLCSNHELSELQEQLVMCVYNVPRKQIGKVMSDCLIAGAQEVLDDPAARRATTVFMKPADPVTRGAQIGLLAEENAYAINEKNLDWNEFTALDLRIGTVVSVTLKTSSMEEELLLIEMEVDLGGSVTRQAIGLVRKKFNIESLIRRQVMVLANFDSEEISRYFHGSDADVVLCTVAGKTFVEPAKVVANGYKIA